MLPTHGRYLYSNITKRPDYTWPNGRRLAVYVALNIEAFSFGMGKGAAIAPPDQAHSHSVYSWRDYGNRVGMWRLFELFDRLEFPIEARHTPNIFVTATGMKDVIRGEHFLAMKDGAIVCNTGHYDVELNLTELAEVSTDTRIVRADNREYTLENGKKVFVLADGRLVNLAAAEGHPSEVMDMSFANQFMAHLSLVRKHESGEKFDNTVIDLPVELDQEIAGIKLETLGLSIDTLSDEQKVYATDYSAGT